MSALYNEIEPFAAEWLGNLAAAGHVAPGVVDARSIKCLTPDDLAGHAQCHFFAGIGVWSYALRLAGWPDDRPVWTGSCPCQPFSAAGRRKGTADERHLWPYWFKLIRECRPPVLFGEQVASPDALAWLDLVRADLEGAAYAFGAADLCAAGVGAPHIRQRLYWTAIRVADDGGESGGQGRALDGGCHSGGGAQPRAGSRSGRGVGGLANDHEAGRSVQRRARLPSDAHDAHGRGEARGMGHADERGTRRDGRAGPRPEAAGDRARLDAGRVGDVPRAPSAVGGVGDGLGARLERISNRRTDADARHEGPAAERTGQAGPWSEVEWLPCLDGKWRPTQPGLFPLAHGAPARVGRLRAFGNAIVSEVAATFIRAVMPSLACCVSDPRP